MDMPEQAEDITTLLLGQIRELNETLDSVTNLRSDQLKAIKILRLTLLHILSFSKEQLSQISERLRQLNTTLQSSGIISSNGNLTSSYRKCIGELQDLASPCKIYSRSHADLVNASEEIDLFLRRLKTGELIVPEEVETYFPRTSDRPPAATDEADTTSNLVLVVDDIAVNQKLIAMRLQKMDFQCEFASNGQQALEKAITGKYALIFMDCDMPIMDGFQASQLIRKAELDSGRHVPIVALTSLDRADDRERCLSAGMDEYLNKGASFAQLQEVVDWCLRRSRISDDKHLSIDDYEEELDLSALSKQYSKEELNEIFEPFLSTTNTLMRCLRMSMDERNVRSVAHFAYSLKGPFSSLGMLMTGKLTARLTDAVEENQWEEANDYYDMLCRNCEAIRHQLEERASKA